MKYLATKFNKVQNLRGEPHYYCPGCNASPDDYDMIPVTCPCATHGSGSGSLSPVQVINYLKDNMTEMMRGRR